MSVVVPLENDPHAVVQGLLPWYARGQLDDAETGLVQQHLLKCEICRAELATERPLQALMAVPEPAAGDVEAALARLRPRLDDSQRDLRDEGRLGSGRSSDRKAGRSPGVPPWVRWTLGLQGAAIALLLVLLVVPREPVATYRGLSDTPLVAGRDAQALIMFRPDLSEHRMRALLQAHGASIVGGPTESGAYRLKVSGDSATVLAQLRADPGVVLVESLMPGGHP